MKKTMLAAVAVLALLCGATQSAHAVFDGTPSTGSFTIVTNSALASASATGTLTVVDTASLSGTRVNVGPYTFVAGRDYQVGTSTFAAATNLTAAINASQAPVTAAYVAGNAVITLTAIDVGTFYNAVTLATSASGEVSVGAATLSGGQDNASVSINGITLVQGRDWFKQDVASNTAVNLAAAINHNLQTSAIVNAQWTGNGSAVVFLRSVLGTNAYTLSDNVGAAITEANPTMQGGAVGNITLNPCFLGPINTLPTAGYPAGCLAYLISDPTRLKLSTGVTAGITYWTTY